jgi:8-amino-7-oxononanoate synthase
LSNSTEEPAVSVVPSYAVPKLLAQIARMMVDHLMGDIVVERVDGRRIRVDGRWLIDFASCNYLGLDLDPEIQAGVPDYLARWGTHPSWARMIASPALCEQVEEGTLLLDLRAHRTMHDAATLARAGGATVRLLREARPPRILCIDGINSMTGNPPDLPAFAALARAHDALLYVDDAHGFGVVGERSGYDPSPFGRRGNAIVRFFGESYDSLLLTAGFSKAYSSMLAFVTCPSPLKRYLKVMAPSTATPARCRCRRWPPPCSGLV